MHRNLQQSYGKYYSPRDVFECIRCYWALEYKFYYPMTQCNHYNDHTLQTMMAECEYCGNEAETLVEDL